MAMDSSECNGSGESPKVEFEAKAGEEFGSEKDLAKSDGIASAEREVNDQDGIGGPFVIINGDSDNSPEKILELDEKADPETTGEDKVSPSPPINAGNEIGVKEVEDEVELKSGSDPAQGEPSLEKSELREKVEEKSMEGTGNEESSESRENNLEFRGSAEKKELSETVVEQISQEEGKDQVLGSSVENKYSSEEPVVEEILHEKGKECELSLAGGLENKKDVNFGMHESSENINREENGSDLVSDTVEKVEEEHPISGSIETVEGEIAEAIEQEVSIAPAEQVMVMHEESEGGLSDSLDAQKEKAEMSVTQLEEPTLAEAVEDQKEEEEEIPQGASSDSLQENSKEVEIPQGASSDSLQENSKEVEIPQGASSDSLQENSKEVEIPQGASSDSLQDNTKEVEIPQGASSDSLQENSKEVEIPQGASSDSLQDNTKEVEIPQGASSDSLQDNTKEVEIPQGASSDSLQDNTKEVEIPQGASDSLQDNNKEVEMPETESKEQPLLDSSVGVESELRHEVQQEESSLSQEDEEHEESEGVSNSLQINEEESDTPGTELINGQPPLDSAVRVESEQKHEEQQEASSISQEEGMMREETDKVAVPSEGKKEFVEAPETELKEEVSSSSYFETESKEEADDQDKISTVCYGKENGGGSESSSPCPCPIFLVEMEKKNAASCGTSPDPDQEKLAESETTPMKESEHHPLEVKDESETVVVVSDTVAEDEESKSINAVEEEMHKSESGDATPSAVSASPPLHEIIVDLRSVNDNELVVKSSSSSSSEVLPESSECKSTTGEVVVEESDSRSVTEFEDGPSKTEAETVSVSVSSNDASSSSAREIGLDDSVQIGKFKISIIGENGPTAILQEEAGAETTRPVPPEEPGTTSTFNGDKPAEVQPLRRLPIYIIKVPRYSDEDQWEKIQEAQARLDELTRTRDAIRDIMQKRRKACSDSWDEVVRAKEEERAARAVFNAKRHEISTVQSVINKLNKAHSIDDMDDLIEMKEKTLQHETMTLKQEKMVIQEIKELKAQRKKLIENMGSAAEIDEAFDQKDSVVDKLKTLKTELEVLGKTLTKAEAKTRAAQNSYDEIDLSYCALQDEHKSADDVRQKAYLYWRDLKSELAKKNKHFFNYRDDQKRAASLLGNNPPDKEGVRLYCNRQVEKVMELWNNDGEFRKQYIESNKISTLRRLRTVDGRSLGPDEFPPVIPTSSSSMYRRTSTPLASATKEIRLQRPTSALLSSSSPSSLQQRTDQFPQLPPHHKPKASPPNNDKAAATSSREKVLMDQQIEREAIVTAAAKEMEEDEMERRKRDEEAERGRREEDIKRKAKAEAEEKERLREEQKAKAKEAEERKKRKADKAQERAEFKARKEAEIRHKKREKKEKKKGTGGESDNGETTNGSSGESIIATSEIAAQINDTPAPAAGGAGAAGAAPTAARRQVTLKQLKRVEPVPVALRNRGRRKMRSWIIAILTALAALLTVFFLACYVNFSHISSFFWL